MDRPTPEATLDELRQTLEKLVVAPFALIRAATPRLHAQRGGIIVMVTSCRAHVPMPGGAVADSARATANALEPHNIAVKAVAPNFLYSEAYYPRATLIESPIGRDYVMPEVPIGRLGRPDEIGELIRYLASTGSRFFTGAVVDFSGGWPVSRARPAT